jgi:hypothetical protein
LDDLGRPSLIADNPGDVELTLTVLMDFRLAGVRDQESVLDYL